MSVERDKVKDLARFILELYDSVRELDNTIKTAVLGEFKESLNKVILRELIYSLKEPRVESREELEMLVKELLGVREGESIYEVLKRIASRSSSSRDE